LPAFVKPAYGLTIDDTDLFNVAGQV